MDIPYNSKDPEKDQNTNSPENENSRDDAPENLSQDNSRENNRERLDNSPRDDRRDYSRDDRRDYSRDDRRDYSRDDRRDYNRDDRRDYSRDDRGGRGGYDRGGRGGYDRGGRGGYDRGGRGGYDRGGRGPRRDDRRGGGFRRDDNRKRPTGFAILELKYGNIYGGEPNFYAIAEISVLFFEKESNKIFMETWQNDRDINYVSIYSKVDELGHTIDKVKEVVNMRSGRVRPFQEDFELDENSFNYCIKQLVPTRKMISRFLQGVFRKYNIEEIITFDGRRDIWLCEKSGFKFTNRGVERKIFDLQKELNKETKYLFSLNKLSHVINFEFAQSYLRSNNLEYWLHPIAADVPLFLPVV